jgi:molecular chaperone DnaK
VDSPEDGLSYLEPVFRKNNVLPLHFRTNKQLVKTIRQGSSEAFSISVYEGPFSHSPEANKKIGRIVVSGADLERDIVKGSDIELEFEMSESRDLSVKVIIGMTDQEFKEVFSPANASVDLNDLQAELILLTEKTRQIIADAERKENYEHAGKGMKILDTCKALATQLQSALRGSHTEDKFEIETHKRHLAIELEHIASSALITRLTTDWYQWKENLKSVLSGDLATEDDERTYESMIANEKQLINSGSVRMLKDKIRKMEELYHQITRRRKITYPHLLFIYSDLKGRKYRDERTAQGLIAQGEAAIENRNEQQLYDALVGLSVLYNTENPDDVSDKFNPKTGIR